MEAVVSIGGRGARRSLMAVGAVLVVVGSTAAHASEAAVTSQVASAASGPGTITVTLTVPAVPLNDVDSASPFYSDITWLSSSGITKPGADGKFGPGNPVQRSAMAAFLYRSAGSPTFTAPTTSGFTDVAATDAFYKEMSWLAAQGITKPGSDGKFGPAGSVSRAAMAAFLYRFAGSPAFTAPTTSPFTDVATGDAFYKEMSWLAAQGITKPGSDGKFGPAGSVSREAMAAFLHRADTAGLLVR
ncbi:MAG: S-layer homology domain-containing protein [Cellulomonas sp.]|nr:S-layer homology domain-containing protein [Cellulomonas sp.]